MKTSIKVKQLTYYSIKRQSCVIFVYNWYLRKKTFRIQFYKYYQTALTNIIFNMYNF